MKPRLLFFISEDWYFWSHRLSIARAARDAGFEVLVASRVGQHRELIEKEGFKLIPIGLKRKSRNISKEIFSVLEIARIYRRERPDIVHHVAVKPVLYGSLAARLTGVPAVVNAVAGLGFVFMGKGGIAAILKYLFIFAYRLAFLSPNTIGIFQNPEDLRLFVESKVIKKEKTFLIRGSGVSTSHFIYLPEPLGISTLVLAARMIWDKGIGNFVEAARILKNNGIGCRMILVGRPDSDNPKSISEKTLRSWDSEGIIEWWGYREDMLEVFAQSNIVVLPTTYGEGVPRVLIEAASRGRAIVATDVPGCR
jgi:glycosyltransferase involved in cell wall biosynthesis